VIDNFTITPESGESVTLNVTHSCGHKKTYGYWFRRTAERDGQRFQKTKCIFCKNEDMIKKSMVNK
jgi:hypothetical protein